MSKQTDLINVTDAITVSGSNVNVTGTIRSDVSTTGDFNFHATSAGGGAFRIYPDDATTANPTWQYQSNSSEDQAWVIGGVERMRLEGGNLLVGTTDPLPADNAVEGFVYRSGLSMQVHRDAGPALGLGRGTNDGPILNFLKDGSTVGSIGARSAALCIDFLPGSAGLSGTGANRSIVPGNGSGGIIDNVIDLGLSSYRFDDIYATNGTIQTSDRNEKQDIASLTPTEMLVAARLSTGFKNFRWKDSVAEKGAAARMHSGAIAQDVQDAFTAEGLDAGDYSMFISATWWTHDVDVPAVEADEDNDIEAADAYTRTDTYETLAEAPAGATERTRMGIRYPELLAFVGAYNEQRFASIETRLAALEAV